MALGSKSQPKQFFQSFFLAGTIAAFSKTLVAPIETKIFYAPIINSDGTSYLQQMLKDQGRIALWRDNGRKIKNSSPSQGFNFAFYDLFKKSFCSSFDPKTESLQFLLSHMAAGAAAGGLTILILYPLQLWKPSYKPIPDAKKKPKFSIDEISKRYKGFNISAVGVMIYRSVYFGVYETAKKVIFPQWKEKSFIGKYFVALGVATFGVILTKPVDAIRNRMTFSDVGKYNGALDCAKKLYNEAGWKAFVRVTRLNLVSAIVGSLNLVLYDELKGLLFEKNDRNNEI